MAWATRFQSTFCAKTTKPHRPEFYFIKHDHNGLKNVQQSFLVTVSWNGVYWAICVCEKMDVALILTPTRRILYFPPDALVFDGHVQLLVGHLLLSIDHLQLSIDHLLLFACNLLLIADHLQLFACHGLLQ